MACAKVDVWVQAVATREGNLRSIRMVNQLDVQKNATQNTNKQSGRPTRSEARRVIELVEKTVPGKPSVPVLRWAQRHRIPLPFSHYHPLNVEIIYSDTTEEVATFFEYKLDSLYSMRCDLLKIKGLCSIDILRVYLDKFLPCVTLR